MVSKTYEAPYYTVSSVFCHFCLLKSSRRTQHAIDVRMLEEKQSLYWPGLALRAPGGLRTPYFKTVGTWRW